MTGGLVVDFEDDFLSDIALGLKFPTKTSESWRTQRDPETRGRLLIDLGSISGAATSDSVNSRLTKSVNWRAVAQLMNTHQRAYAASELVFCFAAGNNPQRFIRKNRQCAPREPH